MDLKFTIKNQILSRTDSHSIVNKSRNYLECYFSFKSIEWNDVEKFAIFKDENDDAYNVHLGTDCECSCIVPYEVLKQGDFFRVTVYGGNLITTTEQTILLLNSGYTTDIQTPTASEVDVFNEIFTTLNKKIDNVVFNDGVLEIYSDDRLIKSINLAYEDLTEGLMQTFSDELETKLQDYVTFEGISFSEDSGVLRFE